MSSFLPPAVPPGLRDAAEIKIDELHRFKTSFKSRYEAFTSDDTVETTEIDTLKRLSALLEHIKEHDPNLEENGDLLRLTLFVQQAQNDRSISQKTLERLEKGLKDKLERYWNRLEVSTLHVELLNEVLHAGVHIEGVTDESMGKVTFEDEYEMVGYPLETVVKNFDNSAFSFEPIDEEPIEEYLNTVFDNDAEKEKLEKMRTEFSHFGNQILKKYEKFDEDLVFWCIEDLLKNELPSVQKKEVLQGYLQSSMAISELTSTLNMKSIRDWNFCNSENGLSVTVRQNSQGEYVVTVEEDIIDMLFLHSLAASWGFKLREVANAMWPDRQVLLPKDTEKVQYWLQPTTCKYPCSCPAHPPPGPFGPMPPMPPMPPMHCIPPMPSYDSMYPPAPRRKGKKHGNTCTIALPPPPPPPPLPQDAPLNDTRRQNYLDDFLLPRLPREIYGVGKSVCQKGKQSLLLKTLATEAKLRLGLDGQVSSVMADFNFPTKSIPHQTILAVLKFIGVPKQWLDVFQRFLSAPLNMSSVTGETGDRVRPRTSGLPLGHGLETFFSEAVLFFLDLSVHKKTHGYLYRLRDKGYFVGKWDQVEDVRRELRRFGKAMHIGIHIRDIVEEPIGFIRLTVSGNEVAHTLIDTRIETYARRMKKRLASCNTVIEWIRTWNKNMGINADHLFGPLANVFGKSHPDAVIQAYKRMYEIIFDGGNLTTHVENLLKTHLKRRLTKSPPFTEALIYLPHELGGLGVKNPFIELNITRKVAKDPSSIIDKFNHTKRKFYEAVKAEFESMTPTAQAEKLSNLLNNDKHRIAAFEKELDPTVFPNLKDMFIFHELASYPFQSWGSEPSNYNPTPCLSIPFPDLTGLYLDMMSELHQTPYNFLIGAGRKWADARATSSGGRWVLNLYGDECIETYGRLEVWEKECVPTKLLDLVRGEQSDIEEA